MLNDYKVSIRKLMICTVLGMIVLIGRPVYGAVGSSPKPNRVLFLSSYSYSWPTVPLQLKGIEEGLGENAAIDICFMNMKNRDDINYSDAYERLKMEIGEREKADAVIVGDDDALHFIELYGAELFPDTPVVFEGINDVDYAVEMAADPLITGVIEKLPYYDNLDLMAGLYPDAVKIVGVVDNTVTGLGEQQQFLDAAQDFPQWQFEMLNTSLLTETEIIRKIAEYGEDTVLVYLIMSDNKESTHYTNYQACQILSKNAQVPVFRFVQAGIGQGLLGGKIALHDESGKIAGDMVRRIFDGTDPANITLVEDCPTAYCFDWQIMKQYHITKAMVPQDSIFLNEDLTFYESNGLAIAIALCAIVFVIFTYLIASKSKVKRKVKKLEYANSEVSEQLRQEKSRSRTNQFRAEHDPLTRLLNRNAFDRFERDYAELKKPIGILMLDIDSFKRVNDIYGCEQGDAVLMKFSALLFSQFRSEDKVFRFGGDEFVVIMTTPPDNPVMIREKIWNINQRMEDSRDGIPAVTVSAGYAWSTEGYNKELYHQADKAMYRSRNTGKGGCVISFTSQY